MKLFVTLFAMIGFISAAFTQSIETNNELERDFSTATLTAKNVSAFEFRAQQKVRDFCNYIQLVSDKSYSKKLREHSKRTALTLFNSDQCTVVDSLVTGNPESTVIETYFDLLLKTDYYKITGEALNITLSNELMPTASGGYSGTITYTHALKFYNKKEELLQSVNTQKQVTVILSKKLKSFGETEKEIWVVALCDIHNL